MQKPIFLVYALIALAGCATVTPRFEEPVARKDVGRFIDAVNEKKPDVLAKQSGLPFLLDGEIVTGEQDMEDFWQNALAAGFSLPRAEVVALLPADPAMAKLFAGTWEAEIFFGKYVPTGAFFVQVRIDEGEFVFIFSGRDEHSALHAMKGPIQ